MNRSKLAELNVPYRAIKQIHKATNLSHDATFTKVANKSVISDAIRYDGKMAIAIDKYNNTYSIGIKQFSERAITGSYEFRPLKAEDYK